MYFKFAAKEFAVGALLVSRYLTSVRADTFADFEKNMTNLGHTPASVQKKLKEEHIKKIDVTLTDHEKSCNGVTERSNTLTEKFKKEMESDTSNVSKLKKIKEKLTELENKFNSSPLTPDKVLDLSADEIKTKQEEITKIIDDFITLFNETVVTFSKDTSSIDSKLGEMKETFDTDVIKPSKDKNEGLETCIATAKSDDEKIIKAAIKGLEGAKNGPSGNDSEKAKIAKACDSYIEELKKIQASNEKELNSRKEAADKLYKEKVESIDSEKIAKEIKEVLKKELGNKKEVGDKATAFYNMVSTIYKASEGSAPLFLNNAAVKAYLKEDSKVASFKAEVEKLSDSNYVFSGIHGASKGVSRDDSTVATSDSNAEKKEDGFFKSWTFYGILIAVGVVILAALAYFVISSSGSK